MVSLAPLGRRAQTHQNPENAYGTHSHRHRRRISWTSLGLVSSRAHAPSTGNQPEQKMGSFLSSLFTPPPLPGDDGDSAVVAVHSKATWDKQWEAYRNSSKLMVIDFSASWCGPCRFIEPAFKEMASRFPEALFVKIDVDELAEVAKTFRIEAMPTFVLVNDGQEVSRVVGAKKDELDRKIKTFISSS